jgi:prepilin-type N-terminal cleavage/methylation domain-containing protein
MTSLFHHTPNARRGFTLVELMVTLVIIAVLSSLSLAGLNGARHRSKVAKTQSTLRKIDDAISNQFDSYVSRRMPLPSTAMASATARATERLTSLRALQVFEMPDSWGDVAANPDTAMSGLPSFLKTGPAKAYAAFKNGCGTRTDDFGSAECLYMTIARSGFQPDQLDQFRNDEVSDYDKDNAPEFKDGWNTPIAFVRWAPGYSAGVSSHPIWVSPIQINNVAQFHDPLDIQNVDPAGYALYPLIVSAGPDEAMQVRQVQDAGRGLLPAANLSVLSTITTGSFGGDEDPVAVRDNISNHSLRRR